MKVYFFLIVSLFIIDSLCENAPNCCKTNSFVVKTKLTKDQLQALLKQSEIKPINLKKNNKNITEFIEGQNNTEANPDEDNNYSEEDQHIDLDDGNLDDDIFPWDEFKVKEIKQSETTTLISKTDKRFIDTFYEKRFGKIYAYLTFIFFIFVLIRFNNLKMNDKVQYNKVQYVNYYDFDFSKENMITKSV